MTKFDGLYNIRTATPNDRNFVLKSFLEGVYYGDSWFSKIPKRIFMDNYKNIAQALFDGPRTAVQIACLIEDPDTILGYSILSIDHGTVHWVYVKKMWRNRGIATNLVPPTPIYVSHLTSKGEELLKKFKTEVLFNPFSL